jgi:hypothetical protein
MAITTANPVGRHTIARITFSTELWHLPDPERFHQEGADKFMVCNGVEPFVTQGYNVVPVFGFMCPQYRQKRL